MGQRILRGSLRALWADVARLVRRRDRVDGGRHPSLDQEGPQSLDAGQVSLDRPGARLVAWSMILNSGSSSAISFGATTVSTRVDTLGPQHASDVIGDANGVQVP